MSSEPIRTYPYTDWTREAILDDVKKQMKDRRFAHVLRVEECAVQLAKKYGAPVDACSLAALLHDYAKEHRLEDLQPIIQQVSPDPEMLVFGSEIWHGPAGAYYAKERFGITDETILNAIREHTIGGTDMGLVSKVLFVADYIEKGRTFDGVEKARLLAERSLDAAAFYKITHTLIHLVEKKTAIYPGTVLVYNQWIKLFGGKE